MNSLRLLLFNCSVVSDSLRPHGLQHTRLPYLSPLPGVCLKSCPLNWWCHLILCHPLSSCLQSFPASGSFPMSWPFTSGGQSIGASASVSVLSMNIQGSFPLGLMAGLFFLHSKVLSTVFSSTTVRNQFFDAQSSLWSSSHIRTWLLEKPWLWLYGLFSVKWCVCFLICSLGLSAFFPRSMRLLISWLQSLSPVILEPRKM